MANKQSRVATLVQALASADPSDRIAALKQLREFAGSREAYHAIKDLLRDGDREVRLTAQEVLREYDQAWESSLAVVTEDDRDPISAKSDIEDRVGELIRQTKDDEPYERMMSMQALAHFAQKSRRARERIREMHNGDKERAIRERAGKLIRDLGDPDTGQSGPTRRSERFEGHVMVVGIENAPPSKNEFLGFLDRRSFGWVYVIALAFVVGGIPRLSFFGYALAKGWTEAISMAVDSGLLDVVPVELAEMLLITPPSDWELWFAFGRGVWLIFAAAGLVFRKEYGRWLAVFYVFVCYLPIVIYTIIKGALGAAMAGPFAGFYVASLGVLIAPFLPWVMIMFFLNRPHVLKRFEGRQDRPTGEAKGPAPIPEGAEVDRKTEW